MAERPSDAAECRFDIADRSLDGAEPRSDVEECYLDSAERPSNIVSRPSRVAERPFAMWSCRMRASMRRMADLSNGDALLVVALPSGIGGCAVSEGNRIPKRPPSTTSRRPLRRVPLEQLIRADLEHVAERVQEVRAVGLEIASPPDESIYRRQADPPAGPFG
jgi:hypothetical protein